MEQELKTKSEVVEEYEKKFQEKRNMTFGAKLWMMNWKVHKVVKPSPRKP